MQSGKGFSYRDFFKKNSKQNVTHVQPSSFIKSRDDCIHEAVNINDTSACNARLKS